MITLGVALGIVSMAGFMLMAPLYLLIGIIGLLGYAIVRAVEWISDKLSALNAFLGAGKANTFVQPQVGAGPWANIPAITAPAANDNSIQGVTAAPGAQALQSMNTATENGQERGGAPVHIAELNVTVPQAEDPQHQAQLISQSLHTELAKLVRQAS